MSLCTRCKVNEGVGKRLKADDKPIDEKENLCDQCAYNIEIALNFGDNFKKKGEKNGK
jgi:hypothetical protein